MKTQLKNLFSTFALISVILLATLIWGCGCNTSKPTPDLLAGWQIDFDHQPSQAIQKDYQDYIQKLPASEKDFVGAVGFLKDGAGQHAIHITIGVGKTWWEHVLFYDKDDKRVKVIKYRNGGYRS